MRNFATESGKSKEQFYTPAEVSSVVAAVAGVDRATSPKQTVYDPTCGSGSMLLKAADAASVPLTIYGQEFDITTRGLARMNMIMHGSEDAEIAQGDVIADPQLRLLKPLVAGGPCDMDTTSLEALLEKAESGLLDAATIAALDAGRAEVANNCGGLHADALMDKLMAEADRNGSYRDLRYKSLAQIGSDLLTEEQHVSLDGRRDEMVAINDEASGDRYVQYMHFIVGLRSLD